jgi:peroxiredoxin
LNRFHDTHSPKGWQVVGLAVDGPTPVREFLTRMPLSFPVGLAGLEGADLSRSLGNTSGALPFTVVFDPRGRIRHRKLGVTNREELAQWASTV